MKSRIVKHSVIVRGRHTSVSLEDAFWKALCQIARRRHVTPSELIREINEHRNQGNLSSAIRMFVLEVYKDQIEPPQPKPKGGALKLAG